jgi:exodeoxyribonuclease I
MDKSYVFYDLETTGLQKEFHQVVDVAAIRTNLQLEPLEKVQWFVRLNQDVVPCAQAVLTHQLTPQYLAQEGQSEARVLEQVHRFLNQPGTCSGGYNSLGFDDEFLRFSFYRNFLPPYTHQYAQGCSRFDCFPMVVYCYLFAPHALAWPKVNGQVSLKLEALAQENHFSCGQAHRAMADVSMTLALAQHLQRSAQVAWSEVMAVFNKGQEQQRFTHFIQTHRVQKSLPVALLIDPKYGYSNHFQMPALALGRHQHYKNQQCWLRLDLHDFVTLAEDDRYDGRLLLR